MKTANIIGKEVVKHSSRHRFLMRIVRFLSGIFIKPLFRYQCIREKGPYTPTLVISNHNTDLDPPLIAYGFSEHLYFVASEHALRGGFASKLLQFIFDPIPINKAQPDSRTLKEIIKRLKAGFSVCIFAEGNRSFNGVTQPLTLATAKLVKLTRADLITFRIEGGYFTTPRWGKKLRRGKTAGRVTGRYPAKDLAAMTADQVLDVIERGIREDAYERQKEIPVRYRGKDLAENIETALYLCPLCKKIGTVRSCGSRFFCPCGLDGIYTETGFLEGENLPFSTITEWARWQTKQLAEIINGIETSTAICVDEKQQLFTFKTAAEKTLAGEGPMFISRTEFHCAGEVFPLEQIKQFAIIGKMTLLFSLKGGTQYEIRSPYPRSALKYLEIFQLLQNENEQAASL